MPRRKILAIALLLSLALASLGGRAGQSVELISTSLSGTSGNGDSVGWSITPDGRYVAFYSRASDLVTNDTNNRYDVFVRDRETRTTELISVSMSGTSGNNDSEVSAISADGRYVAFQSVANNLVPGDTNGRRDIFVRDRIGGTTERITIESFGAPSNAFSDTGNPSVSADGRLVAYFSEVDTFVQDDHNGTHDVFVYDRQLGITKRISVNEDGIEGNGSSQHPWLSADGRVVAFASQANNLVAADTNSGFDIFVHNLQTGSVERVNLSDSGEQSNGDQQNPKISADGRFVAFTSTGTNLVPGDANGTTPDIFVRDRVTSRTTRVSVGSDGAQGNSFSSLSAISADGRFVAFTSYASNLVSGDTNGTPDIFVRDLVAATTARVSVDSAGNQGNSDSDAPAISAEGRVVAFSSAASNLVPGDTNNAFDVFVHDHGPQQPSGPPEAPVITRATPLDGGVALALSPATENDASLVTGYRVGLSSSGETIAEEYPAGADGTTAAVLRGLRNDTPYEFKASAMSAQGVSQIAPIVSVTPQPASEWCKEWAREFAQPILLAHGWNATSKTWDNTVEHFIDCGSLHDDLKIENGIVSGRSGEPFPAELYTVTFTGFVDGTGAVDNPCAQALELERFLGAVNDATGVGKR
jgi:hypothetical protein